jgi:EAL domain-containing protein (putative c-di-GMP-specific phosphodiesterase class I)
MQDPSHPDPESRLPYLEYYAEGGRARLRVMISRFPFVIGRSKRADYIISTSEVSKQHAEIICSGDQVRIRDLGSTNGTFVNGQRITDAPLATGDILHFAHREFRFVNEPLAAHSRTEVSTTDFAKSALPISVIRGGERLLELLERQSVLILFQPIFDLQTRELLGYEALGRSTHLELKTTASELFRLAEQCKLAAELSDLLRRVSVDEARNLPGRARIFLNLHPTETLDEKFVRSLCELRDALRDDQKMVLEVHENMVTDVRNIRWLRDSLQQADIELAYDDFGAGQARLTELVEVPPNFVKLDMKLVRGIDQAAARQDLIQALTFGIRDLDIEVIAEGIETAAEASACRRLGCHFGQGFLLGRPQPASLLRALFSADPRYVSKANAEESTSPANTDLESFRSW